MTDLASLALSSIARGIGEGRFSAEEVTLHCLERIRRQEGRIRAWAWLDADRALSHARAADRELREGRCRGPLHGVPIGIKDIIHVRDLPTGMGSPIFRDCVADVSAACVERLEQAGAFVQGKTATTEFAAQHPAATANPWNTSFSPGGSSSGSAAAVAAAMTPAALGSQTRGSIIRPAVYCGIVGFKPTFGLISRFGVLQLSWTLDHVGVLTRSIDDAALLVSVLAGHDTRDSATLPNGAVSLALETPALLAGAPRLAAVRSPLWPLADATQQALFETDCATLRAAGARVEAIELPEDFAAANEAARVIQLAEIAHNFRTLYERQSAQMSDTFRALCERGMRVRAVDYWQALGLRDALRRSINRTLEAFDAIITPPATGEPPMTLTSTGDAAFCTIWTLCGLPSVTFPTALGRRGLPMGLQVVGAERADEQTLAVAKWCQARFSFHHRVPH